MESPAPAPTGSRLDRACYVAAVAITLGWFFLYDHFRPDYLVDEAGHLGDIYHFLEGKPGWPEQMTMLPGYHFIVAALWQLHPPLKLLTLARLVTTLFALGGLAAFSSAWRRLHPKNVEQAGHATLLFTLLPILQPFTGMAYTDAPALALVLAAFAAQFAGRWIVAALLLVCAIFVRQTNVVWVAFLIVWEWNRLDAPRREFFGRVVWLLALLALSLAAVLAAGRITLGTQTGTEAGFNIANVHAAALVALLLGLPAWLAHLPAALRSGRAAAREYPGRAVAILVIAGGITTVLAVTFANPHVWNRDLFWGEGTRFTLLRNWPLVWLEPRPVLRVASALSVVLMSVALLRFVITQPRRRELWLALAFGALLPLGNNLVEPRYLIPVAAFLLLFADLETADVRRLMGWWVLLCVLHAPFIARGVSLW